MEAFEGFFTSVMGVIQTPDWWPNAEYQREKAYEFAAIIVVVLAEHRGSQSSGELRARDVVALPNEPGFVAAVRMNLAVVRNLPLDERRECTDNLMEIWGRQRKPTVK